MDFTTATYTRLLGRLQAREYVFQTVEDFIGPPEDKTVILRHDVDRLPKNALAMAKLEHGMGVVATYYFRAVPESWDEKIILQISSLGHEIGYHYESLTTASNIFAQRRRGAEKRRDDSDGWKDGWTESGEQTTEDGRQRTEGGRRKTGTKDEPLYELAYEDFCGNLEKLRELAPVKTVCMHGSPLSGVDNLDLLRKYDYKSLGLVAEPYLDVDFDEVFYLTDTGRRWDGWKVSVRDKMPQQEEWVRQGLVFHTTWDIIRAVEVPDARGRMSDVGGKRQRSEVGGRRSEVRGRISG